MAFIMKQRTDLLARRNAPQTIDLRAWDASYQSADDTLDLSDASTAADRAEADAFFETLPLAVRDPLTRRTVRPATPAESVTNSPARLLWLGAVMIGVIVLALLTWAFVSQLRFGAIY